MARHFTLDETKPTNRRKKEVKTVVVGPPFQITNPLGFLSVVSCPGQPGGGRKGITVGRSGRKQRNCQVGISERKRRACKFVPAPAGGALRRGKRGRRKKKRQRKHYRRRSPPQTCERREARRSRKRKKTIPKK